MQSYYVSQNDVEVAKWYRLAAEHGNVFAQTGLGFMYHDGRGVPQSYIEAVRWYRLAASQGRVDALMALERLGVWP